MQNVDIKVNGTKMTITVDVTKSFGLSKTGKSKSIASTMGNQAVATADGRMVYVGLNVYEKVNGV